MIIFVKLRLGNVEWSLEVELKLKYRLFNFI